MPKNDIQIRVIFAKKIHSVEKNELEVFHADSRFMRLCSSRMCCGSDDMYCIVHSTVPV